MSHEPHSRSAQDVITSGEEHFQIAHQGERVVFWVADAAGNCELVSANWLDMTGQTPSAARGTGWLGLVADEDRGGVIEAIAGAVDQGRGVQLSYRLCRPDGGWRRVWHDAAPRRLPSGRLNGLLATIHDRSDSHASELALATTTRRVLDFIDHVAALAVALDGEGRVVRCNARLAGILHCRVDELLGSDWIGTHVAAADREALRRMLAGTAAPDDPPVEIEFALATPTGPRLCRWHPTPIRGFSGGLMSLVLLGNDITRWCRLGDSVRLSDRVFASSAEAMVITDRDNRILAVNASFTRLTGYSADEAIGQNPKILQSGRHDREFYQRMWEELLSKGYWRGDIWDRRKDGSTYPKYLSITVIRDDHGEIANFAAVFHDVSERKALEARLDRLAHFDELTGLPNRSLLHDRIEHAIAAAERHQQKFALLFIDLDGFKPVNDTYGHGVGDAILRIVGERLRHAVRGMDTAARLGGDEFVVVLTDIHDAYTATQVAEKIGASLAETYCIDGNAIDLSASIGVSIYPNDEVAAEGLLRNADSAMYSAKRDGRQQVRFFGKIA